MAEASFASPLGVEELQRIREEIRVSIDHAREQLEHVERLLIAAKLYERSLELAPRSSPS
ncbi:MAG: hypothetical protein ABI054_12150 [Planctomycetota bacterium]